MINRSNWSAHGRYQYYCKSLVYAYKKFYLLSVSRNQFNLAKATPMKNGVVGHYVDRRAVSTGKGKKTKALYTYDDAQAYLYASEVWFETAKGGMHYIDPRNNYRGTTFGMLI